MKRELSGTWWLLGGCGLLNAAHATMNLLMLNRLSGPAVRDMGWLAIAAGACAVVVGLWASGKDHAWLFSLYGLALAAFGVIAVGPLVRGRLSFRPVSLLFLVMAASIGAFALATAQKQRRGAPAKWFLSAAGAAFLAFALSFIAVGFRLFRLELPHTYFVWMGSYFGLCAAFMLWLAFRLHGRSLSGQPDFSPLPSPRHAH